MKKNNMKAYCIFVFLFLVGRNLIAAEFRFTGDAQEQSVGLYDLRRRAYDPEIAAFIQKDPIGVEGGLNLYQYSSSNPVNRTDRTGQWFGVDDSLALAGGALFGAGGQFIGDLVTVARGGEFSPVGDYLASAIGGAVTAETALYAIPTTGPAGVFIAGAAGGAVGNLARQGFANLAGRQSGLNVGSLATETLVSTAFAGIGGKATTSSLSQLSNKVKGEIGEVLTEGYIKVQGLEIIEKQAQYITSSGRKPVYDFLASSENGVLLYVESKFGTSTMSSAQRAGAKEVPVNVVSWTYEFWIGVGGVGGFSGVLIDKAATLVGANLADIKGATYDPVSNQIVFLGSNSTPGVEGIDMDYFFTAVKAVYGSAVPPFVSLDAPASASTLWADLGDGDGNFEPGEYGGFTLRYNPLWSGEDTNVGVKVRCKIGTTSYDFTVNFTPQPLTWLGAYTNGQTPMHLVYASTTGTVPPGVTVWNGPFLTATTGQTSLPSVNTSTTANGGQDFTYPFQLYNGGTGTITNVSMAVLPDRQHRRFGGRLEDTKLGWVIQEADRIMKCLAIGKDNVTGATYSSATVPVPGYKNLAEINQAGTSVSGNTRVWFLAEEMALKRHVDTVTGQATIVFDKAIVGVKTESALLAEPQSPGVAAFATHLQANFDAFAAREFPVISPDDPTGQTIVNLKIFKMLKDAMQAVSLARFFRDNTIPLDMWWMNGWKAPVAYSARSVPTIANDTLGVFLYGGVQARKLNTYTPSTSAQSVGAAVATSRPIDTLHPTEDLKQQAWTATTSEGTFKAVAASMNAGQSEGILNLAETDLSFASPGALPLEFTRYYQSGYIGDDGMGPGWRAGRYVLQFERPSWFDENNMMTYLGSQLVPRDERSDTRLRSGAVRLVDLATGATLDFQSSFTVAYSLNASGNPKVSLAGLTAEEVPVFTAGTRKDGTELVQNADGVLGYSAYLPDGSILVFDPEGRLEIASDRHSYAKWYFRDGQARVTTIQDSANRTLTLAYDATSGRLASVTGPVGERTDYNYDTGGRLETVVHQRSSTVIARYSYNADNQLLDVTRMDGTKLVSTTPDLKGRSDERKDSRSNVFDYGYYQDASTGTKTTQIKDKVSTLAPSVQTADAQGRTATVADPLNNTVSFGYDGASLLPTSVQLPTAGRPAITIARNASGQPTSISDPAVVGAQAIGLTYNAANRVTQVTDETGRAIQADYNDAQDLTKVRRFLGATPVEVGYGYLNGYLRTVTNPLNKSWTMVRDTYGRVTSVVDPTNVTLTMEYDSRGRLWRVTDPRLSSAITYTFDDLDRVETITTPAGVTRYAYDPVTKWLKTITDVQNRTVTFTYDATNGDVTKASYAMPVAGGGTTTLETNYSYARFGDLKTVAAPGAQPTTFQVDDLGRVTGTTEVEAGLFDAPRGLVSNHATSGVWSNQKNHTFSWGAPESSSPVNGYNFAQDATAGKSVTTTSPTTDWNNVSDGQHTAHVRARNEGGFWSPESIFALWVDATPPVLSGWGFSPAIIPSGQANTNQTVSVTVNDALSGTTGQVPSLRWCISGDATRNWSSYTAMTSGGSAQWTYLINANWPQNIGKKLYYEVRAGDVAGNVATSGERSQNITNGEPGWWVSPVSIFDGQPKDNSAVINVGQLKHVATQAKAYLDTKLGLTVADWNTAYGTTPNPFTSTAFVVPQTDPENFNVANIGQLKMVAAGFYTILKNKASSYDVKAKLYSIGVTDSYISGVSGGPFYPWASDGLGNSAPATVGQLKVVFSFDLP